MPGSSWDNEINAYYYTCDHCGAEHENYEQADYCCESQPDDTEYDDYGSDPYSASYPPAMLEVMPQLRFSVPVLDGRPARPCSLEQEVNTGAAAVAKFLHDAGLSDYRQIQSYGADTYAGSMIVKHDSSVPETGGEIVYSRFDLTDSQMVTRFSRTAAAIEAFDSEGLVSTGLESGTHIHIGARNTNETGVFGPEQMAALYEIFSYLEEIMFPISASGWAAHRGTHYSQQLEKRERMTPAMIGRNALDQRRYAINFQRLMSAATRCSCGACAVGAWNECYCGTLNSGTIEWRIFNASTDPKTLYAWLLITHAVTAKAFEYELGELDPVRLSQAMDMGQAGHPEERHPWLMGWLLNECPFTDGERAIVVECAKHAPGLMIDWSEFDRDTGPVRTENLSFPTDMRMWRSEDSPSVDDSPRTQSPGFTISTEEVAEAMQRMNAAAAQNYTAWIESTNTATNVGMAPTLPWEVEASPEEVF